MKYITDELKSKEMGETISILNGFISLVNVDFKCPKCNHIHTERDYDRKLAKSDKGFVYILCKGCKVKLGVSVDMRGDVVVWLKSNEDK